MSHLCLYMRAYCHLCEDMATALAPLAQRYGVEVRLVDIEGDAALEARYGEKVPVLTDGDLQLCHYFLDEPAVRRHLEVRGLAEAAR
jgi:thiol-disulfide isomerase/thioredoxin